MTRAAETIAYQGRRGKDSTQFLLHQESGLKSELDSDKDYTLSIDDRGRWKLDSQDGSKPILCKTLIMRELKKEDQVPDAKAVAKGKAKSPAKSPSLASTRADKAKADRPVVEKT